MHVSYEDLKREITLDAYVRERIEELTGLNPPEAVENARQRLEQFVREIRGHAEPGDTWWEWTRGTEFLMQQGGLAVVRDGKIIWSKMTWRS
jgi:hypothetical protein